MCRCSVAVLRSFSLVMDEGVAAPGPNSRQRLPRANSEQSMVVLCNRERLNEIGLKRRTTFTTLTLMQMVYVSKIPSLH